MKVALTERGLEVTLTSLEERSSAAFTTEDVSWSIPWRAIRVDIPSSSIMRVDHLRNGRHRVFYRKRFLNLIEVTNLPGIVQPGQAKDEDGPENKWLLGAIISSVTLRGTIILALYFLLLAAFAFLFRRLIDSGFGASSGCDRGCLRTHASFLLIYFGTMGLYAMAALYALKRMLQVLKNEDLYARRSFYLTEIAAVLAAISFHLVSISGPYFISNFERAAESLVKSKEVFFQ